MMSLRAQEKKHSGQEIMELDAAVRAERGGPACARLRRQNLLPGNLYGHRQANVHLSVPADQFAKFFAAGHRIVHLRFSDHRETGMVKEVQYDALGDRIVHVDFTRVDLTERVHLQVPVVIVGVAKGTLGGGVFDHVRKELDIEGPAGEIPEEIELNVSEMAVGDMIRVRDIVLPAQCTVLHVQPDDAVVAMHAHRKAAEPAAAEAAEPTVIGKTETEGTEKR